MRRRRVPEREQFSVAAGAQRKFLLGVSTLPGGIEHLRTSERECYRSLHEFGGGSREQGVAPLKTLGAERAADERREDADGCSLSCVHSATSSIP